MSRVLRAVSWGALGAFWPMDDGRTGKCSCCLRLRSNLYGGPLCASRVQLVEAENLALTRWLQWSWAA